MRYIDIRTLAISSALIISLGGIVGASEDDSSDTGEAASVEASPPAETPEDASDDTSPPAEKPDTETSDDTSSPEKKPDTEASEAEEE